MYPSADELIAGSTGEAAELLTAYTPEQREARRRQAIATIEDHCGQRFVPTVATVRVDGSGTGTLFLPQRLAVLDAIDAPYSAISAATIALAESRDRLTIDGVRPLGWAMKAYYDWQSIDLGAGSGGPTFPDGDANIEITGTWGWLDADWEGDPAPLEPVRQALRVDMEDQALADANQLGPTIRAFRALGVRGFSQGRTTATLGRAASVSPEVQRLLAPFVWHDVRGAVA